MGNSKEYEQLDAELKELRRDMILNFKTWNHQQMEKAINRAREISKQIEKLLNPKL